MQSKIDYGGYFKGGKKLLIFVILLLEVADQQMLRIVNMVFVEQ